ncbi:MAG: hypothetical protein J6Z50_01190 [Fibrobacterales bacterium]|nr:hypothetical protein [Fibrobacterales bacterium]
MKAHSPILSLLPGIAIMLLSCSPSQTAVGRDSAAGGTSPSAPEILSTGTTAFKYRLDAYLLEMNSAAYFSLI